MKKITDIFDINKVEKQKSFQKFDIPTVGIDLQNFEYIVKSHGWGWAKDIDGILTVTIFRPQDVARFYSMCSIYKLNYTKRDE